MKKAGYFLITAAFLVGAFLTSLDHQKVSWEYFIPTIVVGFIGVILVRVAGKKVSHTEEKFSENISNIESSLNNILDKLAKLNEEKTKMNPYDVRHKIDELLIDDLNTFVDARETIGHVYSLQAYAEVMSSFAGGERYLNRTWSASADGYIDEVNSSLDKALEQFKDAKEKLDTFKTSDSNQK
jgi:hypothetical protein